MKDLRGYFFIDTLFRINIIDSRLCMHCEKNKKYLIKEGIVNFPQPRIN